MRWSLSAGVNEPRGRDEELWLPEDEDWDLGLDAKEESLVGALSWRRCFLPPLSLELPDSRLEC